MLYSHLFYSIVESKWCRKQMTITDGSQPADMVSFIHHMGGNMSTALLNQQRDSQPRASQPCVSRGRPRFVTRAALMVAMSMGAANLSQADVASTYNATCAACHDNNAFNTIQRGDTAAWQALIKQKGMPTLVNSVKYGMPQMPAGGLCSSCSEQDIKDLILYMSK